VSARTARLVDPAIRAALAEHAPGVTGLSCLADVATRSSPVLSQVSAASSKSSSRPPGTVPGSRRTRTPGTTTCSPARSFGGTADVVAYAREHGTPVRVIWPDGAHRD
jgi:hypothetical protein